MSGGKDARRFIRRLRSAGYMCILAKSGHWKVYADGKFVTSISASPSDRYWMAQAERAIRAKGPFPID